MQVQIQLKRSQVQPLINDATLSVQGDDSKDYIFVNGDTLDVNRDKAAQRWLVEVLCAVNEGILLLSLCECAGER